MRNAMTAICTGMILVSISAVPRSSYAQDEQPAARQEAYTIEIEPDDFVAVVDNAYFPLIVGSRYVYEGDKTDEGLERVEIEVLSQTRDVMGVQTTVMRSLTYLEGELLEDNRVLFAEDEDGNVWYFGELVTAYENGQLVEDPGGWEAGVDGALPGIVMHGDPAAHIGETYRQEYYQGEAEDTAKLLSVAESVTIPYGSFDNVVQTLDFTPLEPGAQEHKFYARGIGMIKGVDLETGDELLLIEFEKPN